VVRAAKVSGAQTKDTFIIVQYRGKHHKGRDLDAIWSPNVDDGRNTR